jgi:hypothetical protein
VIRQSRSKLAKLVAILVLVTVYGAYGIHASGFERAFRLTVLASCGLLTILLCFLLIQARTVVQIDHSGVRIPRRAAIAWTDVAGMKITFWTGVFLGDRWVRFVYPTWRLRRPMRFLGFIPVPGSDFDKETAGRLRRINGLVPIASHTQIPMELEELAGLIKNFSPQLALEYGPGAKPPRI